MKSDFIPPVSEGGHYKTPDGEILEVSYYLPEESGIEETVGYFFLSNPKDGKEANIDMWLAMNLTPCSEETTTIHPNGENGPNNPGGNEGVQNPSGVKGPDNPGGNEGIQNPEGEEGHEIPEHGEEPYNPSVTRNPGELDPKLQELESFLKRGPEINAQFFPFNYDVETNEVEEHDIIEGYNKTLKEINDLREQGKDPKKKGGRINEFLWKCGGLDRALLRMCPTDWAKKAGMGGTILGTAALATLSGGFAAYTVAEGSEYAGYIALGIGALWGLIIFNLDRYLVNSMYSDGEPSISKKEFLSGLPRIIIAIFLGIVISTPIELKIFEGKINEHLNNSLTTQKESIDNDPQIAEMQAKLDTLKNRLPTYLSDWKESSDAFVNEVDGTGGSKQKGFKDGAKSKERRALNDSILYFSAKTEADTLPAYIESLKESKRRDIENDFSKEIGLSRKLEAMSEITSSPNSCWWQPWTWSHLLIVRIFISLMFIILEILPVVNKMMQTDGQYDKLIDLESDTTERLTRTKEANNINILRSGRLSRYKSYILGLKGQKDKDGNIKKMSLKEAYEDDNLEDNVGFSKKEPLREDKSIVEDNNQDIFNEAQALAKAYVISEMRRIFGNTGSSSHGSSEEISHRSVPTNGDPTSEAKDV